MFKKKYFGTYPMHSNGDMSEIEWDILDETRDSFVLITSKCIDAKKFNDSGDLVSWKNSSLRKWLNDDFYNKAFSLSERSRIVTVKNKSDGPSGVVATSDKVFLPSQADLRSYSHGFTQWLQAPITMYAISRGGDFDMLEGRGCWWLRDVSSFGVMRIGFLGMVLSADADDCDTSIRPMIKIKK